MARVTAQLTRRRAALAEDFGRDYAARLFGEEALAGLPRYLRGPRTGQLKGSLIWIKAEKGGWAREYRRPVRPNELVRAWIVPGFDGNENDAVDGQWMGRTQRLCGSGSVLTAEYRDSNGSST